MNDLAVNGIESIEEKERERQKERERKKNRKSLLKINLMLQFI